MEEASDLTWTALNEETSYQFGRFDAEDDAAAEAAARTTRTGVPHHARRTHRRHDERMLEEARCGQCGCRLPEVDGVVVYGDEALLCSRDDCYAAAARARHPEGGMLPTGILRLRYRG